MATRTGMSTVGGTPTENNFGHQTVGKLRGWLGTTKQKDKHMISPMLAEMSGSLHIGLAAIGSAIGVGIIGMKAAEATGRNPGAAGEIRNMAIIFAALAEGVVFFAIFLAPK